MNAKLVEDVAAAVLYEGYLLYPYRASAIKNRQRWTFGVLYPRAYAEAQSGADAWSMQTECLVRAPADADLQVKVRFLHLTGPGAMEREIAMPSLQLGTLAQSTARQSLACVPLEDQQPIDVALAVSAEHLAKDLYRLRASIFNLTAFGGATREEALRQSLISTHTILSVQPGEFISLLDPPEELRTTAAACDNRGTWPVLAGEEGDRDAMLSSPIILYDYPQIAPESPGALFDGTEIDEILTLRILTLTDDEKRAMGDTDERAREILERTEAMPPEQFMKMHGVLRGLRNAPEEMP
jgi:hypothetical protein